MPPKTSFVSEQNIRAVPLPTRGGSYVVIPHENIIDKVRQELRASALVVDQELYKCTQDGQIAQGIYHVSSQQDPDISMMFAWVNSYNRMVRFKCAVGARVFVCDNGMVSGDHTSYSRVHKGKSAMFSVMENIEHQIKHASLYFDILVQDKDHFKSIFLNKKNQAALLGKLYAYEEILTSNQVSIVKREMDKPSYDYGVDPNSVWAMYNHVTLALKESHPSVFIKNHEQLHRIFTDEFGPHQAWNGPLASEQEATVDPDIIDTNLTFLSVPSETDAITTQSDLLTNYGVTFS